MIQPLMVPASVAAGLLMAVALAGAYRPLREQHLAEWSGSHGFELTAQNRPMVSWYLRTARILRAWGLVAGVVVPTFLALAWSGHLDVLGVDSSGGFNPGDVGWVFVGYLVGALYAEVALVRPVGGARRSASLVPRRLDDFLGRRVLWAQRGLAASAALAAVTSLALPFDPPEMRPSWVVVAGFAVYAAGFAATLEAFQRWIVRRPQPYSDPSVIAADDAIRSQSVRSMAGAGISVLLLMSAGGSLLLAVSDVTVLRWTMWLPATIATVLALVACPRVGERSWRVRRFAEPPPAVSPA